MSTPWIVFAPQHATRPRAEYALLWRSDINNPAGRVLPRLLLRRKVPTVVPSSSIVPRNEHNRSAALNRGSSAARISVYAVVWIDFHAYSTFFLFFFLFFSPFNQFRNFQDSARFWNFAKGQDSWNFRASFSIFILRNFGIFREIPWLLEGFLRNCTKFVIRTLSSKNFSDISAFFFVWKLRFQGSNKRGDLDLLALNLEKE